MRNKYYKAWAGSVGLLAITLISPTLEADAASQTAGTSVSSVVGATISLMTSSGTVNINTTPSASGAQTIASDSVTVSTNDSNGYTLKLAETSTATALTNGGNTIAASTGTQAAPVVMAVNSWGYRVDSIGGFGAGPTSAVSNAAISATVKFAGVPATASPNTIKTTAATATNDTTSVWYGVATNTSVPSGTYTNSVTYTAVAN